MIDTRLLSEIEMSIRTYNALTKAGITSVADLKSLTEYDVMNIPKLGKLGFAELLTLVGPRAFKPKNWSAELDSN